MMMRRWGGIGVILIGCALAGACVSTGYHQTVSMGTTMPVARPGGWDQPFYNDLAPHGRWVFVSGPGWVWSPDNVQADWRPYLLGHWVYTDYGWTWASDEEWGWATYHYGRWHLDASFGWVWVPGTEWGPAWVAWHEGGGYVGWAPLPWQVTFRADVGLDWGGVRVSISPSWWCFASSRHLVDPGLRTRILPVERNTTLIRVTQNVTNYTYIDNRVINQGVHVEKIGRAVGHTIPRYRVAQEDRPDVSRGGKVRGQDFVVYRADPVRGRNSHGRDSDDRGGRGRVTEDRDGHGRVTDDRDGQGRVTDDRDGRGERTKDQDPRGQDAGGEGDSREQGTRNDDPRHRQSQGRVDPRSRDDRDRPRDDRPGRPRTEPEPPASRSEDAPSRPDTAPPATNSGQERTGHGRDSHPGRGREIPDGSVEQPPPARAPQRIVPEKTEPEKSQPAQEGVRDKSTPGKAAAPKGRKPKKDEPKQGTAKPDKAGDAKPDDDKSKEDNQSPGN